MLLLPYLLVFCILLVTADLLVGKEQRRLEVLVEEEHADEFYEKIAS